jgi:hypothetical protein
MAGVPTGANSTLPCNIITAGKNTGSGAADPLTNLATQYLAATGKALNTLIIRDGNNVVVPGSSVTLDFSTGCGADIRVCDTQSDVGTTVACVSKTVTKNADGSGVVSFRIIGGSNNSGNSAGTTTACVKIYADGWLLGNLFVSTLDQNGTGGVQSTDLFFYFSDQGGTGNNTHRSNYNCDLDINGEPALTAADLFLFFAGQGPGLSSASCTEGTGAGTYCIP